MTNYEALHATAAAALHVFEQDGGWHWGITIERPMGFGFKLIAFSETTFPAEAAARRDGHQALLCLSDADMREPTH